MATVNDAAMVEVHRLLRSHRTLVLSLDDPLAAALLEMERAGHVTLADGPRMMGWLRPFLTPEEAYTVLLNGRRFGHRLAAGSQVAGDLP